MLKVFFFQISMPLFFCLRNINTTEFIFEINKKEKNNITYIFGHKNPDTDSIASAILMANYEKEIGNKNKIIACRLGKINKETKFVLNYFNINIPKLIFQATEADEIILVDHNSPSQGPDDIKKANIVKIIDHHALEGYQNFMPIFIYIQPVGSTCTILYEMYKENNISISRKFAGLMMSAIISDTFLFKSKLTTGIDKEAVEELSEIAKLNYIEFGMEMLREGTDFSDYTENELINMDTFNYFVNGYSFQISYLHSVDVSSIINKKQKIINLMNIYLRKKNLDLFVLVILNIIEMDSTLFVSGKESNVIEKSFNVKILNNEVFIKNNSSIKKEIYLKIVEEFNKYPVKN